MSKTSTIVDVLNAVGIKSVIWIDDRFDAAARSMDPVVDVDLAALLGTLHAAQRIPSDARFSSLRVDSEFEEWKAHAEELVHESPGDVPELVASLQAQVAALEPAVPSEDAGQNAAGPAAEYDDKDLDSILASFGGIVEKVGLEQWKTERQRIIANRISPETLFIVDREFRIDGATLKMGDEILRELVDARQGEANVVMLTHSIPATGVDGLRAELAATLKLPVHRFSVMAKGGEGEAEARLRKSVRILMTHQTCFSILERVATAMHKGIDVACEDLEGQSIYDIDQAIFEKSLEEGASEADVMARLVMLRQRMSVDEMFARDQVCFEQIEALRTLRAMAELSRDPDEERGRLTLLPEWRRREVFDPGEFVNSRHSPISCGDVFQAPGAKCVWVLLAQPCDIAVRSDGKRKFDEAVLVKAKPVAPRPANAEGAPPRDTRVAEPAAHRFFKLPGLLGEDEWQLDFIEWGSVSLRCLDLAVFNPDGALALKKDQPAPPALLPGWRRRLADALEDLKKAQGGKLPRAYELLSLSDRVPNRSPKGNSHSFRFEISRVGRIRAPRAVAAYAAFTSFQSRAAFDHDFADKLSSNGSNSAEVGADLVPESLPVEAASPKSAPVAG